MSIAHQEQRTNGQPVDLDIPDPPHQNPESALASLLGHEQAPDLAQLRAAVEDATELGRVDYDTLAQARSHEEIAADIAQHRAHREDQREQHDLDHQDELTRRNRERTHRREREESQAQHEHNLRMAQQRHQQASQLAEQRQEQILHPAHEVVAAHRWNRWLPWATFIPGGLSVLVSAVNLGTQGVRVVDAPAPVGGALGTGLDLAFTLALILLGLARMLASASGDDIREARRSWYSTGEVAITIALGAASVVAHHLPSADGAPHDASLGWWFLLIPVGLAFTSIFGPMTSEDTRTRFVRAGREAKASRPYGGLAGQEARVLRLARWVAEQDRQGLIPGERSEDGLPSVKGVERHVREHLGRCSNPLARQIRDYYALVSGQVE